MNQLPSGISSSPAAELDFWPDWTKSFNIVIESATTAPIPFACVAAAFIGQAILPFFSFAWSLVQFVASFFVLAKLIQTTYKYLFPETRAQNELFPVKPELKMLGAAMLVNIGTTIGVFFFIVPGIWFAIIHMLTQEIIVLEGCGVIEAMSRSRQLMAGNIWRLAPYCFFWPLAIVIGVSIVLGILAIICYTMTSVVFHGGSAGKMMTPIFAPVFTLICFAFGLTIKTLTVRAYVNLMHTSGNRTTIEQQLGNNIGMG